jgi:tetratricopeptide (TPR) repeat protein
MNEGRAADAIPEIKAAIRILPRNPSIFNRYLQIGYSLMLLGQYDQAIPWLQKSIAADPNLKGLYRGNIHATLAAAQALAGHGKEAHESAAEASQLWPTLTVRGYFLYHLRNPVYLDQVARVRDGLRLAGIRDHADESADLGFASDEVLHTNYDDPTPTTVPGAHTIRTPDLAALMEQGRTLVLDTFPWGASIPGAIALWGAGIGGSSISDEFQDRLRKKVRELTHGDLTQPIVAVGWNSERFDGRNLALRLVALGYTSVYWYRGGREAWEVAGLRETELDVQEW